MYVSFHQRSTGDKKFSLNEEEELTHYGQSLAEIEQFDEPVISDNEDEDDDDKRAAGTVLFNNLFDTISI